MPKKTIMKKIIFLLVTSISAIGAYAQDFTKHLATARTAYTGGKLDDARFAMEQMLQELDIIVGKEILKLLPAKLLDSAAISSKDNVSGTSGFLGVSIHREYGKKADAGYENISLEVITNSPLLASFNALLSMPILAGAGDNKVVKIGGYKALVQKTSEDETANKNRYEVQLPLNNSLITLRAPVGITQDQIVKMANTIPVDEIAKLLQ